MDWPEDPWFVAFDCFEADPDSADGTPYDGGYGVNYNSPGNGSDRWFFGPTYANMFAVNDMVVAPAFALGSASRTSFSWYWGGAANERCIIVIATWERFGDTEAGVAPNEAAETLLDAWAFDFGTTLTEGGYFAGINLASPDVFRLPADGRGAYSMTIARDVGAGGITLASLAQPFLWFTKPENPSFQGPLQWDDDNPADGVHRTNPPGPAEDVELYDYTGAVSAPVPAGVMTAFYSKAQAVPPTSLLVVNGVNLGGGIPAIVKSDDVRQGVRLNPAAEQVGHQLQLVLTATSPLASPTSLELVIEDNSSVTGVRRTVDLFDFVANRWEAVDARFESLADRTSVAVASGDLSRFVRAGTGEMRAKVGYDLVAADLFFVWQAQIDLAMFRVGHP
ncbi:MAG: hypothetical protein M9921_00620 [Fimbriimonadaceae bacterium]|nr:hypothetical protein [Fimbriimonadaceae bacterium]